MPIQIKDGIPFDHFIPANCQIKSDPFDSVLSGKRQALCLSLSAESDPRQMKFKPGDLCYLSDRFDRPVCQVKILETGKRKLMRLGGAELSDLGMTQEEFNRWSGFLASGHSGQRGEDSSLLGKYDDPDVLWVRFSCLSPYLPENPPDSGRLRFRPVELSDAKAAHEIYSDSESMRYLPSQPHVSIEETIYEIKTRRIDPFRTRGLSCWSVTDLQDQEFLGMVNFFSFRKKMCYLGYMFNKNFGGRGFATEALRVLIPDAFRRWDLHRIGANVNPENIASVRLLEKTGFMFEGRSRQNFEKEGIYNDTMNFSLLRSDLDSLF